MISSGVESSSSVSEILARQHLLFDRIIPISEMVEKIEAVGVDDIQNSANKIFASAPTYTLLGALGEYMEYQQIMDKIRK